MFFVPLIMHSPKNVLHVLHFFVNNLLFTYLIKKTKQTNKKNPTSMSSELLYVEPAVWMMSGARWNNKKTFGGYWCIGNIYYFCTAATRFDRGIAIVLQGFSAR